MKTIIRCGTLLRGDGTGTERGGTLVIENDTVAFAGATQDAPPPAPGDEIVDHSTRVVMPGLIDAHVHLSYGRALGEEDLDLYATMEFRALRALHAAQDMLRAGFTSLVDPACSGLVSPSVRDAVECGLFPGPRITAAGRALTSHQGLYDYYPSWIGAPEVSTGLLVKSLDEAIYEIRRQAKDGVDMVKIAMDGTMGDRKSGLYAAFTQEETTAMIREAKRLGRKVGVHARGPQGALYSARAGADVIYHGSRICPEGIRAALDNGCVICPSLLMLVNNIQFAQPQDPSFGWWPAIQRKELAAARSCLAAAHEAGVPLVNGSESGFAVTLYGEWAAKELAIAVDLLGLGPAEALATATTAPLPLLRGGDRVGTLAPGKLADVLVLDGNPLDDIGILQDPARIVEIRLAGRPVDLTPPQPYRRHPGELAQGMWSRLYTKDVVADLELQPLGLARAAG